MVVVVSLNSYLAPPKSLKLGNKVLLKSKLYCWLNREKSVLIDSPVDLLVVVVSDKEDRNKPRKIRSSAHAVDIKRVVVKIRSDNRKVDEKRICFMGYLSPIRTMAKAPSLTSNSPTIFLAVRLTF